MTKKVERAQRKCSFFLGFSHWWLVMSVNTESAVLAVRSLSEWHFREEQGHQGQSG